MIPKLLLTHFDPFGGQTRNTSLEVAQGLNLSSLADSNFTLVTRMLPTSYSRSFPELKQHIEECSPDIVVCLGECSIGKQLRLECRGKNFCSASIADNDNQRIQNSCISDCGPSELLNSMPIGQIFQESLRTQKAYISDDAGAFVCNHLYYNALNYCQSRGLPLLFVHIPRTPDRASQSQGLELEQSIFFVRLVLEELVRYYKSCDKSGAATHFSDRIPQKF